MNLKITIATIGCALWCLSIAGQERAMINQRDKVEKETSKFDPNYWKNENNKHLAFLLKFMQDSTFQVSDVEARMGNMPHRSKTGGQVKVSFLDNNNLVLGSYYTSDPMVVRSCEDHATHVQAIPVGTVIEILTPFMLNIQSIELEHVYQKTTKYYMVGPRMQNARFITQ